MPREKNLEKVIAIAVSTLTLGCDRIHAVKKVLNYTKLKCANDEGKLKKICDRNTDGNTPHDGIGIPVIVLPNFDALVATDDQMIALGMPSQISIDDCSNCRVATMA